MLAIRIKGNPPIIEWVSSQKNPNVALYKPIPDEKMIERLFPEKTIYTFKRKTQSLSQKYYSRIAYSTKG